jgi:hypothetical protein
MMRGEVVSKLRKLGLLMSHVHGTGPT